MSDLPPITVTVFPGIGIIPLRVLPVIPTPLTPPLARDTVSLQLPLAPPRPVTPPSTFWDRLWTLAGTAYRGVQGVVGLIGDYSNDVAQFGSSQAIAYLPQIIGGLPAQVATFQHPLPGARLTSGFGWRMHPIYRRRRFHAGIDLAAPYGTIIRAPAPGRVRLVPERRSGGYGNLVLLDHDNGYSTRYGHTSRFLVKDGDRVSAGQPLARVGSTGVSTGPHLHFEVRYHGAVQDPKRFLANI